MSGLAAALEKDGKGKKAEIVKQLISTENQRSMFRKLAAINKKNQDLSTKSITIQSEKGPIEVTDKLQMERAIINANKDKYHQTEASCPFMKPPLKNHFGDLGKGPATSDVLKGHYSPNSLLSAHTKDYIELCRLPQDEPFINPLTCSFSYFTKSWKRMKEQTSISGNHFGHYKAATKNDSIMKLHYLLAKIPFRTGYSSLRWKEATNVMILKKEGNTNVDKLRILVLFETDFNHNNKFLGRSMMQHMCDKSHLVTEQYSAPGRKCIDHVINRELYFDLIRYQKTSGGMAAVDLKSCYDRVLHAPAYLAMRSYGIPSAPIESMFQTIQDMKYFTFTFHGKSKISFGGKEKGYSAAPNGLGQGNGGAPSAWSIVSLKMFEVMHKRGMATTITSPITKSSVEVCGFAYVDDTDLITMQENNCHTDAKNHMQETINEWEAVSKVTGGALVPSKCWSWIIAFEWDGDRWCYKDTSSPENPMTVKNEKGMAEAIKSMSASEAQEMLGVMLSPDGSQTAQYEKSKEKMERFAEYIRTGHVTCKEAWLSLNMMAMKSFEYVLPAMTWTKK